MKSRSFSASFKNVNQFCNLSKEHRNPFLQKNIEKVALERLKWYVSLKRDGVAVALDASLNLLCQTGFLKKNIESTKSKNECFFTFMACYCRYSLKSLKCLYYHHFPRVLGNLDTLYVFERESCVLSCTNDSINIFKNSGRKMMTAKVVIF